MHDENPLDETPAVDAPADGAGQPSEGPDVLSLIEDVERHLGRIREAQNRQETDFADLAERQRRIADSEVAITAREGELEEASRRLSEAESRLDSERAAVRSRQEALDGAEAESAEARRDLDSLRERLETERRELEERACDLESRAVEHERQVDELASREADLVERVAVAEAEAAATRTELERTAVETTERLAAFESERADLAEREAEARRRGESLDAELDALRGELEEARTARATLSEEIDARRAELEEMREGLRESDEARQSESEASRTTIDRLTAEVAELEEACVVHEQSAAEREEALELLEARASETSHALQAATERIKALDDRIKEDERQLGLAGTKLAELAQVVAEHAPRLERGAEAMALVPELESQIETLRSRLDEAAGPGSDEMLESLRRSTAVRIDQLEQDLAEARRLLADAESRVDPEALAAAVAEARGPLESRIAELEAGSASGTTADGVDRGRYESLKDRCRKAERRSDELETALAMANDRGQAQEMAKRLRGKAERIADFQQHLDRRRKRLAALRAAVAVRRSGNDSPGAAAGQDLQRIEAQRRELEQVREFLGRSEQQMVRRWARPRSVAVVVWFVGLVGMAVAAGWFATNELIPRPGVATVSLTAATPGGQALVEKEDAAWDDWHRALATDPAFVALVHGRLVARGLAPADERVTATMLADDLAFEDEGSGKLRLVLSGADARDLEATLDVVATSMASESARQAPRRVDRARATLPPERNAIGGAAYATLVQAPLDRDSLVLAGGIAGGVLAASVLAIGVVYAFLRRARRVFEEGEAAADAVD